MYDGVAVPVLFYKIVVVVDDAKAELSATAFVLGSSMLVEYTQPHPSPFTPAFAVVWLGLSVWTYRAIRRARA